MDRNIAPGFLGWVSHLVLTHRSRLANLARNEGLSEQDALEAVQEAFETFLVLPQARELIASEEDSAKFLTVIVKNEARNFRRRNQRRHRYYAQSPSDDLLKASETLDPEELILEAEKHLAVLGCLKKLKEMQQLVIKLRLFHGNGGDEIAEILKLSPGNVATILTRAKADLRECLVG